MKKLIGKANNCNFVVENNIGISGKHCELTQISTNTFLLIDLNSTNGTYVNKRRVRRKVVNINDEIILSKGEHAYKLNVKEVFPIKKQVVPPSKPKLEFYKEFEELEKVWTVYKAAVDQLKKQANFKRAGIFLALGAIPFVGTSLAIGISPYLNNAEKIKALADEFKLSWICPNSKCRRYFPIGDSWEVIKVKYKSCPSCKAKYQE